MAESLQTGTAGGRIVPANLDQIFTRDGSGNVTQITVSFNGKNYVQTFTRDGSGNVTEISRWNATS